MPKQDRLLPHPSPLAADLTSPMQYVKKFSKDDMQPPDLLDASEIVGAKMYESWGGKQGPANYTCGKVKSLVKGVSVSRIMADQ